MVARQLILLPQVEPQSGHTGQVPLSLYFSMCQPHRFYRVRHFATQRSRRPAAMCCHDLSEISLSVLKAKIKTNPPNNQQIDRC